MAKGQKKENIRNERKRRERDGQKIGVEEGKGVGVGVEAASSGIVVEPR